MKTLSLAWRNLLRNRRRSLTTLLAMSVGLVAVLLFGGYRSNIIYGTQTGFVQHSGHLQIQRAGYFLDGSDNPTAYGIADYPRLLERIRQDAELAPMLAVVTPTLQLGGIAGNFAAGVSRSVMAVGRAIWTFVCLVLLWLRPPILVICTKVTALTLIGAGLAFLLAPSHGIHWKLLGVSFLSFCLGFGYGLLVIWVTGDTGEG